MATMALLLIMMMGCDDPGTDREISDIEVCEICGHRDGNHGEFAVTPKALSQLRAWEDEGEGEGAARIIQELGLRDTKRNCPRVVGALPDVGKVRVSRPKQLLRTTEHLSWIWTVVGGKPWRPMATCFGVDLIFPDPKRESEAQNSDCRHRWFVTLDVVRVSRQFGPVCIATIEVASSTRHMVIESSSFAPISAEDSLENLVAINDAELEAKMPTRLILATVDGNTLDLRSRSGDAEEPGLVRSPWKEWLAERIYSGQTVKAPLSTVSIPVENAPKPISTTQEAKARAVEFLLHHQWTEWGKPLAVTRVIKNGYRVEFPVDDQGRARALIVSPKNGNVGFPQLPRLM
ncbi:MAG: hypothetical protein V3W41_09505 [Planctomycetota bacterium]